MAKKRKLNSQNPKYWPKSQTEGPVNEKRVKITDVPIRTASGKKTGRTAACYAVYHNAPRT